MENSQFNFRPSYVMHDPTQPGKGNLPVPADTGARSFGFRSGAANPATTPHETEAVAAGAALGEPTSFRGGAGAPPPVAIMRGMRTTFQNPAAEQPGGGYVQTPGSSPVEYATPVQAGQAWNQGMRNEAVAAGDRRGFTTPESTLDTQYGGFRAPGQTVAETTGQKHVEAMAAYNRDPAKVAAAEIAKQKQDQALKTKVGTDYDQAMHEGHGDFDTGTGQGKFKAKDEGQYKDYLAGKNHSIEVGDPKAGRQLYEDRQMARKWLQTQPLPANMDVNAYLDQAAAHPESWSKLMEHVNAAGLTPGASPQKHWYNFGGGTAPATPAAPSVPAPAQPGFQAPAPQPFAGAAEQGEAAGAPPGKPIDLGPGWGKPLGGAGFVQ